MHGDDRNRQAVNAPIVPVTLIGGSGSDVLLGSPGTDTLYGGRGNDFLDGGDGNDAVGGEAGRDGVSGGAGQDAFDDVMDRERERFDYTADDNLGSIFDEE